MNKDLQLPIYLFHQGTATRAYELLGAHTAGSSKPGTYVFRVWAPEAGKVSLVGDFNNWEAGFTPMNKITDSGIWEVSLEGLKEFDTYKYAVEDKHGKTVLKADPYGFHMETRPETASKIYNPDGFKWNDEKWMRAREKTAPYDRPMNIYEVHLGSWKRYEDGNFFDYNKLADELIPYVKDMGYTHLELMPVSEYPFDGSWGYQVLGYFAPTSRYGSPKDFMNFVDKCHQNDIGVILDWVPGHYPKDEAGLYKFDGSHCYEYKDPLKRSHDEWGTMLFDWGKNEVRSFLISNAIFWLEMYHIDGLRVDAVASMLYLDYGRKNGKWRQNHMGGRENLEAVSFLQDLNKAVFGNYPNVLMIAEESTAWPLVTAPVDKGGLGFNYKWNMGWMNDSLAYMETDPLFRKGNHRALTFPLTYAFSENYILAVSHDEVVHGKKSLLDKMAGDYEGKFASLRTYFGYMMAHPGKKLTFMGSEYGQFTEWAFAKELDWMILDYPMHRKLQKFVRDLNHLYKNESSFWEIENSWEGFNWRVPDDEAQNILSFSRFNKKGDEILVVLNFAPVERPEYILPIGSKKRYDLVLNSDEGKYGGIDCNVRKVLIPKENEDGSLNALVKIPPLSALYYRRR